MTQHQLINRLSRLRLANEYHAMFVERWSEPGVALGEWAASMLRLIARENMAALRRMEQRDTEQPFDSETSTAELPCNAPSLNGGGAD